MFYSPQIRIYLPEIKGKNRRNILSILLLLFSLSLQGQQNSFFKAQENPHYQQYKLEIREGGRQLLSPEKPFTSLAFTLADEASFTSFYCLIEEDTFKVSPAPHQPEGIAGVVSELLVFDTPKSRLSVWGLPVQKAAVLLHLIYADPFSAKAGNLQKRRFSSPCDEPEVVQQEVWRAGLPEPQYSRSFNEVDHQIVHHSATSNSLTNYTNVVRNIYLYHTEVNGWSDVGYNYLIAPDGTLFAGRDPAGGEQDNVRGAHFCGKNSQTMGVCLIGDYTQTEPAEAAMQRLEHLLSWKSRKEGLDPLEAFSHPANPALPVVAGHRDGCATLCPGDRVYSRLPALRQAVQANLLACRQEPEGNVYVYFAPRLQEVCLAGVAEGQLHSLRVFNVRGKEVMGVVEKLESPDLCWKMQHMPPGVYFLQAEGEGKIIRKKFMLF